MNYEKYSVKAFEALGIDSEESNKLGQELSDDIQNEMHKVILPAFTKIKDNLNDVGHKLKAYDEIIPGDLSYRDDIEIKSSYKCKLRVSFDSVVSTGYSHLQSNDDF